MSINERLAEIMASQPSPEEQAESLKRLQEISAKVQAGEHVTDEEKAYVKQQGDEVVKSAEALITALTGLSSEEFTKRMRGRSGRAE